MNDSEIPTPGEQVITACVLIHRTINDIPHVFMARRSAGKKFLPNEFELPGGHIEFGEDLEEGLAREVEEELGVTVSIGDPFAAFAYMNDVKKSQSIEVLYFGRLQEPFDSLSINPEDHSEYGWFSKSDIPKLASLVKPIDDDEFKAVLRGLDILSGSSPNKG